MSTKTTFKRVAAVAAAALAIGGFSAVSANAAAGDGSDAAPFRITVADSITANGDAATIGSAAAVAGANNYVQLEAGTHGQTVLSALSAHTTLTVSTSGAGSNIISLTPYSGSAWVLNNASAAAGTPATAVTSPDAGISQANLEGTAVKINTPTAGSVTVTVAKNVLNTATGTTTSTTLQTFTITVNAASVVGTISVGNSSSYITESTTVLTSATLATVATAIRGASLSADDTTAVAKTASVPGTGKAVAGIQFTLKDTQASSQPISGKKLVATIISGPGLVLGTSADGLTGSTDLAGAAGVSAVSYTNNSGIAVWGVYGSGASGVATIEISNTSATTGVKTVLATETVTFYGSASTFTATVNKAYIEQGTTTGTSAYAGVTGTTYVFKIVVTDSAGNPVAGVTPTATPADLTKVSAVTCGASGGTGKSYCQATAVAGASGKTTVTFSTGSAATFDLVSTTADVTVSSAKAATFVVTSDSSVGSGQVVTYTITAADANGLPLPDGALVTNYLSATAGYRAVAGGALVDNGGNANAVNDLFDAVVFKGGVATDTVQAPFGSTTLTATIANNGDAAATTGGTYFATAALRNASATLTTTVTGDAATQAAIDAAQEATDAANAAYDAANNAMDSADAATAAAQDASDNASAALAAVTSLSATVAKLVKSVAAIAAALAKVQKKIGA